MRKEENDAESIELGTLGQQGEDKNKKPRRTTRQKHFSKSLVDVSTQILVMVTSVLMMIPGIAINAYAPSAIQANKDFAYLRLISTIWMSVVPLVALSIYYWRNEALRDFLSRKLKMYFQRINL